jgi:tetratricopeptide (TPR) repeat protein
LYAKLGDYHQAIRDLSRTIELKPKNTATTTDAYYNRAVMYGKVGERKKGWEDMKACARLGDSNAQDLLRSKGLRW